MMGRHEMHPSHWVVSCIRRGERVPGEQVEVKVSVLDVDWKQGKGHVGVHFLLANSRYIERGGICIVLSEWRLWEVLDQVRAYIDWLEGSLRVLPYHLAVNNKK
jgi:hypothetical protein